LRVCLAVASLAILTGALLASGSSARTTKPVIKGAEVGYFGPLSTTYRITVIVYSRSQPRGTHVRVCVKGVCRRAVGHRGPTAWYSASFRTPRLTMSNRVTFSAKIWNSAGTARKRLTRPVLCIKNDGSTPQSS
jgi:hypothetical protein